VDSRIVDAQMHEVGSAMGAEEPSCRASLGQRLCQPERVVFRLEQDGIFELAEKQIQARRPAFGNLEPVGQERPGFEPGILECLLQTGTPFLLLIFQLGQDLLAPLQVGEGRLQMLQPLAGLLALAVDALQGLLVLVDFLLCALDRGAVFLDPGLGLTFALERLLKVLGLAFQLVGHMAAAQLALFALDLLAVQPVAQR
jgi:hypothetical protein